MTKLEQLLTIVGESIQHSNTEPLLSVLGDDCVFRSDYAGVELAGKTTIIEYLDSTMSYSDTKTAQRTYTMHNTASFIRYCVKCPTIYDAPHCLKVQQGDIVEYFVFIKANDAQDIIEQIYFSRDEKYIDYPFLDNYYKRQLSQFKSTWLPNDNYKIISSEQSNQPKDKFVCYRCRNDNGQIYSIFVLFDDGTRVIDGDYCMKLTRLAVAKNSHVLVFIISPQAVTLPSGDSVIVERDYFAKDENSSATVELYEPIHFMGDNMLVYYPFCEMEQCFSELLWAYNSKSLDTLESLFSPDINLRSDDDATLIGASALGYFHSLFSTYPHMICSYMYANGDRWSQVPYIEGLGYVDFCYCRHINKITQAVVFRTDYADKNIYLNSPYNEIELRLLELDIAKVTFRFNTNYNYTHTAPPTLQSWIFLPPTPTERFSVKLCYDNDETRKFVLSIDEDCTAKEVVRYKNYTFTNKIWSKGYLSERRTINTDSTAIECGEGLAFINGFSIGTEELYRDSKSYIEAIICDKTLFCNDRILLQQVAEWKNCKLNFTGDDKIIVHTISSGYGTPNIYTFANMNGVRATTLDFLDSSNLSDGYATVQDHHGHYGIIDKDLTWVVLPQYKSIEFITNDCSIATDQYDYKYIVAPYQHEVDLSKKYLQYEDSRKGTICVATFLFDDDKYDHKSPLAYHHDCAEFAGTWGLIDKEGRELIAPQYLFSFSFANGVAAVCKGKWEYKESWDDRGISGYWSENMLWGFIDPKGNEVVPCIYDEIRHFVDDCYNESYYFAAYIATPGVEKWCVVDLKGNHITEPIFEDVGYELSKDGLFCFYFEPNWDDCQNSMGVYSILERKVILEPQFSDVAFMSNGNLCVTTYDKATDEYNDTIITRDGKPVFESEYSHICSWQSPYEVSKLIDTPHGRQHYYGYIDDDGKVLVPCKYPLGGFTSLPKQIGFVVQDPVTGKPSILDFNEKEILPPLYDDIHYIVECDLIQVSNTIDGTKYHGLICLDGTVALPIKYSDIRVKGDTIIVHNGKDSIVIKVVRL